MNIERTLHFLPDSVGEKSDTSDFFPTTAAENPTRRISSRQRRRKIRHVGFLPDSVGGKSDTSDFFPTASAENPTRRMPFCV
jgi:hypothetical protein